MAATTKAMLEAEYGVTVYSRWHLVPPHLHTRGWYAERGVKIPKSAPMDAIKGGGQTMGKRRISFLFDERKWLSEEVVRQLFIERGRADLGA